MRLLLIIHLSLSPLCFSLFSLGHCAVCCHATMFPSFHLSSLPLFLPCIPHVLCSASRECLYIMKTKQASCWIFFFWDKYVKHLLALTCYILQIWCAASGFFLTGKHCWAWRALTVFTHLLYAQMKVHMHITKSKGACKGKLLPWLSVVFDCCVWLCPPIIR